MVVLMHMNVADRYASVKAETYRRWGVWACRRGRNVSACRRIRVN